MKYHVTNMFILSAQVCRYTASPRAQGHASTVSLVDQPHLYDNAVTRASGAGRQVLDFALQVLDAGIGLGDFPLRLCNGGARFANAALQLSYPRLQPVRMRQVKLYD